MKKIIFTLTLLILMPMTVLAWDDCPHNKIDCSFPGECSRYIDTNNDKICDYSQLAQEDKIKQTENALTANEDSSNQMINKQNKMTYHLIPIPLILILLYFIIRVLSKKKIVSVVNHRKIWNILLLITFLISGILGILLVVRINFSLIIPLPFNILFWHVEISIAMFVICILHIIERWRYFKNLFQH